jgi:Protein of unknown function (DUF2809)
MSRRALSCVLVLITIPLGLLWRHLPLPFFAWKYGGSALWTVALYWFVAALFPHLQPTAVALLSALLALFVELSRLMHQPALQAFRQTLAGKLILGSHFSLKDIGAYWITIAVLLFLDRNLLQSNQAQ